MSSIGRIVAATQNALEIARFGGLDIGDGGSPYVSLAAPGGFRLRHYFPAEAAEAAESGGAGAAAILLVPPLMLSADVYDVTPTCGVEYLRRAGLDPWVLDFGRPEQEDGGLERRVEDHVRALGTAIDAVHEATGRSVHVAGYSQGGMFAYQAAALRVDDAVASLVTFGSAVDTRAASPFGLAPESMAKVARLMANGPLAGMTLPGWASRLAFQAIDPGKNARQRIDFIRRLHDRDSLLARERQRRFLDQDGYVAWPGPAVSDLMRDAIVHNRMLQVGLVVDGRPLSLADITVPILAFVGSVDNFTPPESARGIGRAAPLAETYEREVPAGHFGLVVGSKAAEHVWPTVCAWVGWRESRGRRPREIRRIVTRKRVSAVVPRDEAEIGVGKLLAVGASAPKTAAGAALVTTRGLRDLAGTAQSALPTLSRVASLAQDTRVSMSLLIGEHAQRRPDAPAVVHDDRTRTYAEADQRIDSMVTGLLGAGVRRGERIAVLMETRPGAFVLIAALNRIGAIAVLLRPDGDPALESALTGTSRVAVDAEHIAQASSIGAELLLVGSDGATDCWPVALVRTARRSDGMERPLV